MEILELVSVVLAYFIELLFVPEFQLLERLPHVDIKLDAVVLELLLELLASRDDRLDLDFLHEFCFVKQRLMGLEVFDLGAETGELCCCVFLLYLLFLWIKARQSRCWWELFSWSARI